MLKNSVKRKLSKNKRASTKRRRTKKAALQKMYIPDDPSAGPSSKIELDLRNEENNQAETDLDEKNTTLNDNGEEEEYLCQCLLHKKSMTILFYY